MKGLIGFILIALMVITSPSVYAGKQLKYQGTKKCKTCHRKEKDGNAYGIWQKMKHAQAYKTLGTAKAKKAAKRIGVMTDPQKSQECLICHTPGAGLDKKFFNKRFKVEDGVQCESCHGPGEKYAKKKTMKKARAERKKTGKSATAKKVGLIYGSEETCKQCHVPKKVVNGKTYINPSYKQFNFKERWEEIKHPSPN